MSRDGQHRELASYTGVCPYDYSTNFTAWINVPANTAGGTDSHHGMRSDSSSGPTQTVHLNAGDTWHSAAPDSCSLSYIWGNGSTNWLALAVTAPDSVTANHASFRYVCQNVVTSPNSMTSNQASFIVSR